MEDNENINKDQEQPPADISPTNSWVFVEKCAVNSETSGVQELIEDDMGSSSSCDSDGISVISETECQLVDSCTCLPKINTSDEDEAVSISTDDGAILNNKEILETNNEITEIIDEPTTTITEISANDKVNNPKNQLKNNNLLTYASTVAGVCIFITYLISNFNAVTTHDENDATIDDFDEMLLWTNYDDNDTCDFNIDLSQLNTDLSNIVQSSLEYVVIKPATILQQSDNNLPTSTENKKTINQNVNKEKYANKQDKHTSRNSNNLLNSNVKKSKSKTKNANNQKTQTNYLKQHENYLKKKEKYLTKREKYLKKLEKHIVTMEARFRKFFNKKNKDHEQQQKHFVKPKKSKTNITAGGEWYERMSFGRSQIRQKEKLSDWMFERSKMRNKLRDKAHWYFNRANGREEIRTSENLRSGKRNDYKTYRY